MALKKKEIEDLLRDIFEGSITIYNLPNNLYQATVKKLNQGLKKGFGKPTIDKALYKELKSNIYVFSAAKTYTQVKDISSLILDGRSLRPWNEFKPLAMAKYEQYNVNWLKSEYETSIGQAQTAVKWQQIVAQQNEFPLLQREAVMDKNTSEDCRRLNGIVAPVGHAYWRERSPLTHFNCRCILRQISQFSDVKPSSEIQISRVIKETETINPLFKGNPGIDKVIFNKTHPYFDIDKKDKAFARRNFGLPIN